MSSVADGGRRILVFFMGIFLIIFTILGYETNQINLIGLIFYNIIHALYNIVGFFEHRNFGMPIPLSAITGLIVAILVISGLVMIFGSIFGGGKGEKH